jgi:hypothetical protein
VINSLPSIIFQNEAILGSAGIKGFLSSSPVERLAKQALTTIRNKEPDKNFHRTILQNENLADGWKLGQAGYKQKKPSHM